MEDHVLTLRWISSEGGACAGKSRGSVVWDPDIKLLFLHQNRCNTVGCFQFYLCTADALQAHGSSLSEADAQGSAALKTGLSD